MLTTNAIVKIRLNNKTKTGRTLKVIASHSDIVIDGVTYASFLGRRARFNNDGTVSTYGADHAYLAEMGGIQVARNYNAAYKYLRENHSIDAASRILEDAMSHEGLTRKDDYGFGITYTDSLFYTEAAS